MAAQIVSPKMTPELSECEYVFQSPCGALALLPIQRVAIYVYGDDATDKLKACRDYAAEWVRYGWQIVAEYIDKTVGGEALGRLLEAEHAGKHDGVIMFGGNKYGPSFSVNEHLFPPERYLEQVADFRAARWPAPAVETVPSAPKKPASKKPLVTTGTDAPKVRTDGNDPLAVLWDAQVRR